jgi:hypothetical protein
MAFTRKPPPGNVRRVVCVDRNVRGVTTNKRGQLVQFESELEHALILLLERDPSVVDYRSQPEVLRFRDADGRARTYTPDFQVWRAGGRIELHEVTVEARRAVRPSLRQREAAATAVCRERGWRYIVHTDRSLPGGAEYANLSFLAAYRAHTHADDAACAWWGAQLAGRAPVHPRTVLAEAADRAPGQLLNGLYHLLWQGVVQMDWQRPLISRGDFHPAARIWLPGRAVGR